MTLRLWGTLNGVSVTDGPIFTAISAQIVLTPLNQFDMSSVVLTAAPRAGAARARYLCRLEDC